MKFLLILLCSLGLAVVLPPSAHAEPVKDKLVGTWLETGKSDNLFIIKADGSYRILLKKGEIENVHFLEGTWSLAKDMKITLQVKFQGETTTTDAKVSFEGDELILTNEGGPTRHRRIKGPVPERFTWQ